MAKADGDAVLSTPSPVAKVALPPMLSVRDLAVHYKVPVHRFRTGRLPGEAPAIARALFGAIAPNTEAVLRAVDGISFEIQRGEILGLVGESGCGKSTTGRAIVRLETPVRGRVHVDGIDVRTARRGLLKRLRHRVQMIFQDPFASLNPRMTVGEIIAEPLETLGIQRRAQERGERVQMLMEQCGLEPQLAARYPHEFSGGQRQRIAIARALAPGPRLLIADEPVSALDVSIQAQIINLLLEMQSSFGLSMLLISHDLSVLRNVAQRIAVMYLGRIVEIATSPDLCGEPLHPYTRALLSAVPIPDPIVEKSRPRVVLSGDVPSRITPPPGCPFHPRCPDVQERCRTQEPLLKLGKLGRPVACHVAHGED